MYARRLGRTVRADRAAYLNLRSNTFQTLAKDTSDGDKVGGHIGYAWLRCRL